MSSAIKRAVNLSLDAELVAKAKKLRVNISAVAEAGLAKVVHDAEAREVEARADAAAMAWNDFYREHLTPAEEFGSA